MKTSVICRCCHEDAFENSTAIFTNSGKEEEDDDENVRLDGLELLAHEDKEDNEDEYLEVEERNLQVNINISEPVPFRAAKWKKRHQ